MRHKEIIDRDEELVISDDYELIIVKDVARLVGHVGDEERILGPKVQDEGVIGAEGAGLCDEEKWDDYNPVIHGHGDGISCKPGTVGLTIHEPGEGGSYITDEKSMDSVRSINLFADQEQDLIGAPL